MNEYQCNVSDSLATFSYDAINRLTSVNDSVGGTISWVYDTVSGGQHPRVLETTTAGTMTVEYDEIGRRVKLSATGQATRPIPMMRQASSRR